MTVEEVIEKFEKILACVPVEQSQALAEGLAQIAPVGEEAEIAWKASWVYDFDENIVHGSFDLRVNPAQKAADRQVRQLLESSLQQSKIDTLEEISFVLNQLIDYTKNTYEIKISPAMYLKDGIGVFHFGINGLMKDAKTVELLQQVAYEHQQSYVTQ